MKEKLWYYILIVFALMIILSVCKKKEELPSIETLEVTDITDEAAGVMYKLTSSGRAMALQHGVCWDSAANPTIFLTTKTMDGSGTGSAPGSYWSYATGLMYGKTYHVRAYATNSVGTVYGKELTFTTRQISVPEGVTTKSVSVIASSAAISGGDLSGTGGASRVIRGVCWSINPDPTPESSSTGDILGMLDYSSFTSVMTDLNADTKYYVRAYASNQKGVTYGDQVTFTTGLYVVNFEGKLYNSVTIGTQVWLTENLASTTFNDGTTIPLVTDQSQWNNLTTPGYCWFNNDKTTFGTTNGALYNWYAVNSGKLCPVGWHVPSDAEWTILTDYLGSEPGAKIRKPDSNQWTDYPSLVNNCLFWAKPCGIRDTIIGFETPGECDPSISDSHWWSSSTSSDNQGSLSRYMYSNELQSVEFSKKNGFSVRCVKD